MTFEAVRGVIAVVVINVIAVIGVAVNGVAPFIGVVVVIAVSAA